MLASTGSCGRKDRHAGNDSWQCYFSPTLFDIAGTTTTFGCCSGRAGTNKGASNFAAPKAEQGLMDR
jgi:hypothetical protein